MNIWYIALVDTDGSTFGITFPDMPGCVSAADTFPDVMAMGEEALNFHVEGLRIDGDAIPEPRDAAGLEADPEVQADLKDAFMVHVPLHDAHSVAAE